MLAGAAVHVVHRGNNRGQCFLSDDDRAFYLHHLGRALPRCGCLLHAYCLMDNHVHLLLTTEPPNGCALLMKSVAQLYAQYFNKSHARTGYLWEGRFKSCLVQAQHYALSCYRYIELNPVRAAMVRAAEEFSWSSFHVNARGEAAYRDLFGSAAAATSAEEIRRATNGGFVLGDRLFKNAVARLVGRRVEASAPGRRPRGSGEARQGKLIG